MWPMIWKESASYDDDASHQYKKSHGEDIMIFHMPACSGCGNCSMACSFHNEGEFAPAKAAIRSVERDDGQGYLISFSEESDEERLACTGCKECVKLCVPGEDLEGIIVEYIGKRKNAKQPE